MSRPTKAQLDKAVEAMQAYLGALGKVRFRDEQRFYNRVNKHLNTIAQKTGMELEDVWRQIETEARRRGITTPIPGRNFNPDSSEHDLIRNLKF